MAFLLQKINIFIFSICILANVKFTHSFVSESELIPFSEWDGNSRFRFGDDNALAVQLTVSPFKFLNHSYWTVYISGNGLISFRQAHKASSPDCQANTGSGIPMVIPFWADANEAIDPEGSQLTYMESTNVAYRTKIMGDIRRAFREHRKINLTWLFVVTWKNIASHAATQDSSYRSKRNTFQLILATNGINSFVLLYYSQATWNNNGVAFAGFDFGTGRRYKIPGSCSASINNIVDTSNINVPGKWVFQVDRDIVESSPTTRSSSVSCDQSKRTLRLDPPVVSIMGNIPVFVHGLCLEDHANVTVTCTFLDKSQFRASETKALLLPDVAICPVPFLYSLGKVTLNILVSYEEQAPNIHTADMLVVKEHEFSVLPVIHVSKFGTSHLLSATWNPEILSMTAIKNADTSYNDSNSDTKTADKQCQILSGTVQIVLLEYDGKKWQNQGPIIPSILNNGIHMSPLNNSLLNSLLPRKGKILLRTFAIQAKYVLRSGESVSKVFPSNSLLGTNNLIELTINLTSQTSRMNFFDKVCQAWYDNEPNLHLDTQPCPNIVEQARVDWRFSLDNSPHVQLLNEMASAVYMQSVASPSGAAAQCAYDMDGRLLIQVPSCGRVFRYSPNSVTGYWKHCLVDVLPYMYCCKWRGRTKDGSKCNQYFLRRPTDSGTDYVFPRPIRAVGDPHITTFDGLSYTFNGAGEYWMIKYKDDENDNHLFSEFKMQVRMEPFIPLYGEPSNASIITSAVMEEIKNEYEVKVQVGIDKSWGKGLSVFVDGEPLKVLYTQDAADDDEDDTLPKNDSPWIFQNELTYYHTGVTIVLISANEALISFASGFSFNVKAVQDTTYEAAALNIIGQAGTSVKNKIEGLVGNYDGLVSNDFKLPNGSILQSNLTMEDIHKNFGVHWVVSESETIFSYPSGKSYHDLHQPQFNPWLLSPDEEKALSLSDEDFCGDFEDCIFDYLATGSSAIAIGTKGSSTIFQEIDAISKKIVRQCSKPVLPVHGSINTTSYVVESTLHLTCNSNYSSTPANHQYQCLFQNGNEDGPTVWIDSTGLVYHSMACESRNGDITTTTVTMTIAPETETTSDEEVMQRETSEEKQMKNGIKRELIQEETTKKVMQEETTEKMIQKESDEENLLHEGNTANKLTSSESSSSVGSWIFLIGMIIFTIIVVVVITEYPPCKPVRNFFTEKYQDYRINRSQEENINLS